jgi:hypothetical protein
MGEYSLNHRRFLTDERINKDLKHLFDAMWPKQQDKIKVVEEQIERHARLMRTQFRLEDIQREHEFRKKAFKHFDETEKDNRLQRRQDFRGIKTDIGASMYDDTLNHLQGTRCEGTEEWLLRDIIFKQWLDTTTGLAKIL